MSNFPAEFGYGDMVADEYSGFTGQVIGVCFYKTGVIQYLVHSGKLTADGAPLGAAWLNARRLSLAPTGATQVAQHPKDLSET